MRIRFVSTRRGSHFMTELLGALAVATEHTGHDVEMVFDRFPVHQEGCVYVVIPHEFHAWGDPNGAPDSRQLERTIALCTENPGTPWFDETYELAPCFAAAISINRSSAAELRRLGVACEHLQLGYWTGWDTWQGDEDVARSLDVLYLGAADPRRDPLLGVVGAGLWSRNCEFLIPPLEPRVGPRPDFLTGMEKYHRLRSAQILLNLHRTTSSAFEWMRFLEAICNGCVVVSEPSLDSEPLIAGEHFLHAPVGEIAAAIDGLLDDPARLRDMRRRTYDFVRAELPMELAGRRLAELAGDLPRAPARREDACLVAHRQVASELPSPQARDLPSATPPGKTIFSRLRKVQRNGLQTVARSVSYDRAKPRISVLIVSERTGDAAAALASVASSIDDELEALVLAEAWSSHSGSRPSGLLPDDLPSRKNLPLRLLRPRVDRGLGQARNELLRHARGEYVLNLDADARLYPSTLQRLVSALDADPQALFAYPMVVVFQGEQPVALHSSLPWEPQRLERENWIDPVVLIRRERLLELGGYSTDPRPTGQEDIDLWRRCARAGGHGVHVPQVLARRQLSSLNDSADTAKPSERFSAHSDTSAPSRLDQVASVSVEKDAR